MCLGVLIKNMCSYYKVLNHGTMLIYLHLEEKAFVTYTLQQSKILSTHISTSVGSERRISHYTALLDHRVLRALLMGPAATAWRSWGLNPWVLVSNLAPYPLSHHTPIYIYTTWQTSLSKATDLLPYFQITLSSFFYITGHKGDFLLEIQNGEYARHCSSHFYDVKIKELDYLLATFFFKA